jgi:hypothetical protein
VANKLKLARYGAYVLAVLVAIALFDYWLPNGVVGRIGGTEVKRMDAIAGEGTRDVRYITVELRGSRKTAVFENVDSPFFYLKFDSANVQGEAQNLASRSEPTHVLVRHYGWRIPLFSMFPNVISMKEVDAEYTYIPWARIIAGIALLVLLFVAVRRFRRWRTQRAAAQQARLEHEREERARLEAEKNRDIEAEFIHGPAGGKRQ